MKNQNKTRKRKGKDLDEVHDDLKKPRVVKEADPDLPGEGKFYCVECARHFVSEDVLGAHRKTKLHKKRIRELKDAPYSQAEAEAAGGVGTMKDLSRTS